MVVFAGRANLSRSALSPIQDASSKGRYKSKVAKVYRLNPEVGLSSTRPLSKFRIKTTVKLADVQQGITGSGHTYTDYSFSLSDVNEQATFAHMFDFWRIAGIQMRIESLVSTSTWQDHPSSFTNLHYIYTAVTYDLTNTTWTNEEAWLRHVNSRFEAGDHSVLRYFRPVAPLAWGATGTGSTTYAGELGAGAWLSWSVPATKHFGFHYLLSQGQTGYQIKTSVFGKYYLEFKNS